MEEVAKNQRSFAIAPWIVLWAIYTLCCAVARIIDSTHIVAGVIVLVSNLTIDIVIIGYTCWLWQHSSTPQTRTTFGLLALSFLGLLGVDIVYYTLYDILQIPQAQAPAFWTLVYNLFYFGFLLFQLLTWSSVLLTLKPQEKKFIFFCIPATIMLLTSILIYILAIQWNPEQLTLISFYDGWDEILELLGFFVATFCLITAKNRGIFYLALGFSFNTFASLLMDFQLFSQVHGSGSILETSWFLSSIFMLCGLLLSKRDGLNLQTAPPWLELPVSTRAQIIFWGLISGIVALLNLVLATYFFK